MLVVNEMPGWSHMAGILEAKTVYEDKISQGVVSVPKNRRQLTAKNAEWFLQNARRFNKVTDEFVVLEELVAWYHTAATTKVEILESK